MWKQRVGPDPHRDNMDTPGTPTCPDIWELEDGRFAVIGEDRTTELRGSMPPGVSAGVEERIVVIPRRILVDARNDIPIA